MKRKKFLVCLFAALMAVSSFAGLCACATEGGGDQNKPDSGDTGDTGDTGDGIEAVFAKYTDISKWNFAVTYREVEDGVAGYEDYYEYSGKNILYKYDRYDDEGYNFLGEATDYLGYNTAQSAYYLYYDNLDGTHSEYKQGTSGFTQNYLLYDLDLTVLGDYAFNEVSGVYEAAKPNDIGNAVVGEFTNYTWTKFEVRVADGKISQIDGTQSDGFVLRFVFSKYGGISFTLPDGSSSGGTDPEPSGTMEKQTYDADTFDNERLQQKLTTTGDQPDPATGLPSTGTYDALVIPVKFSNTTISQTQLNNLNIAFNGTSEQTGWESVKTYYNKASYGKLNLSFDIAGANMSGVTYYTSTKTSSYYENLKATDEESGEQYNNGDNVLLHEVLAYYESKLDLTKYDTNGDGSIDAVYLIYSAPVDYSDDSFYWAYVTWNYEETKYDGKDTFYYLFAGLGFMEESVQGSSNQNYPVINGLKVNASTYIHETGHLLGLDDYYDYYPDQGCNEGLGGADMMDATVGDQNVYSKTMLGWLDPEIVTSTQTVTLSSSQAEGDAILIPLNFNNSYFCEYLLVDLYSAQGLNALHSSSLYGDAGYGVRIYHVSSSVTDPFNNDFGSFTDYNNSMSDVALIKLVEADGENKFASSDGYAAQSDLWQAGDKLSDVFPKYTTNAGKLLIFDITVVSVSATQATVTITYNA